MRQRTKQGFRQGTAAVPLAGHQAGEGDCQAGFRKRRIRMESLVIVRRGGVINGTWMYAEVAVAYAEWLSPEIGKNCNEGIKEIIGVKTSK